uniref:Uncharacterized protein n=1 Tax=Ixodes ricinus TaxID=34613 RepID=A0A147BED4_IXORI
MRVNTLAVLVVLLDVSASQFPDFEPLDRNSGAVHAANLPEVVTRSERDDDDALFYKEPTSTVSAKSSATNEGERKDFHEVNDIRQPGSGLGASFGVTCRWDRDCDSRLGLVCRGSNPETSRCACPQAMPVYLDQGRLSKCSRARTMYESCVSDQECSYRNPNLRCVDFLCYCPQPYELIDSHKCLPPASSSSPNLLLAIAPAAVLLIALLFLAASYSYRKAFHQRFKSGGCHHSSEAEGLSDSTTTRHVSSAIRLDCQRDPSGHHRKQLDAHLSSRDQQRRSKRSSPHAWHKKFRCSAKEEGHTVSKEEDSASLEEPCCLGKLTSAQNAPPQKEEQPVLAAPASALHVEVLEEDSKGNRRLSERKKTVKQVESPPQHPEECRDLRFCKTLGVDTVVVSVAPLGSPRAGEDTATDNDATVQERWRIRRPTPMDPSPQSTLLAGKTPETFQAQSSGQGTSKDPEENKDQDASSTRIRTPEPHPDFLQQQQQRATGTSKTLTRDASVQIGQSTLSLDASQPVFQPQTKDLKFIAHTPGLLSLNTPPPVLSRRAPGQPKKTSETSSSSPSKTSYENWLTSQIRRHYETRHSSRTLR